MRKSRIDSYGEDSCNSWKGTEKWKWHRTIFHSL